MSTYSEEEISQTALIGRYVDKRRHYEDCIESEVTVARHMGMSWAKIGLALNTSGQAAWQRYGMTPEQKAQLVHAQELRFKQLELDMDAVSVVPARSKAPRQKRKRNKADR